MSSEVLLLETALVLEDEAVIDLLVNILLFVNENGELFHLDAVALSADPLVEGKVLNEGILGVDLDLSIVHLSLEAFLFALKVLLRLQGHADLGELENNLEVGEEVEESAGVCWVGDVSEELALLLLHVHVDHLCNLVDPLLLVVGGVAVLHLVGQSFSVGEDVGAFILIGGILIFSDELADQVEDFARSLPSWGLAVKHDLFDLLERVGVAGLNKARPSFVHGSQDLVDAIKLLVGLHHATLLLFDAVDEVLFGDDAVILLAFDLCVEGKTNTDSEHDNNESKQKARRMENHSRDTPELNLDAKSTYRHGLLLKIRDLALNLCDGVLKAAMLLLEFLKLYT